MEFAVLKIKQTGGLMGTYDKNMKPIGAASKLMTASPDGSVRETILSGNISFPEEITTVLDAAISFFKRYRIYLQKNGTFEIFSADFENGKYVRSMFVYENNELEFKK